MELEFPPPLLLPYAQELALLEAAHCQDTRTAVALARRVELLFLEDRFGEVIETLRQPGITLDFHRARLLGRAHLCRAAEGDSEAGCQAFTQAASLTADRRQKAIAQAGVAAALLALGQTEAADAAAGEALQLDPRNDSAKAVQLALAQRAGPAAVLAWSEQRLAAGDHVTPLLAARAAAFAALGDPAQAREILGLDAFLRYRAIPVPEGWDSREAFNQALVAELMAHPGITGDRFHNASQHSQRINRPLLRRSKLVLQLHGLIQREVEDYLVQLPAGAHPFSRACPARARVHYWALMAGARGFQQWHQHAPSWASGVYYLQVPARIAADAGPAGAIEFGLPEVRDDGQALLGGRIIHPIAGHCLLFPSGVPHRTHAHSGSGLRICVSFDIRPVGIDPPECLPD